MFVVGDCCHHGEGQGDEVGEVDEEDGDTTLLPHFVRLQSQLVGCVRFCFEEGRDTEDGEENSYKALDQVQVEAEIRESGPRSSALVI